MNKDKLIIKELELENKYMIENIQDLKIKIFKLEEELCNIKSSRIYKCLIKIRKLKWWKNEK